LINKSGLSFADKWVVEDVGFMNGNSIDKCEGAGAGG